MKKLIYLILTCFGSLTLEGQINFSEHSEKKIDEIVFEDMTMGSSETSGNIKLESIKQAFKTFDIDQIISNSIPAMNQDREEIKSKLDSFSRIFNKFDQVQLKESIGATFGEFGLNGRTNFKSNNLEQLDIDYSYGRESDPKIYRFSIIHNGKIVQTYPKRYHDLDMILMMLKNIKPDNVKKLIQANELIIKLATETKDYGYFQNNNRTISSTHGNLSWYYILDGNYKLSIENAMNGISIYPENIWIKTNEAHAHLLSGDVETAITIYTEHQDKIINKRKFSEVCLKDLQKFKEMGIAIPEYDRIKSVLKGE